jgi:hypothetical protein
VPSLWDTFNFTVVEAMAAAKPVVCSRGAGASWLIEDGVSGFLFDAGDSVSLAAALERATDLTDAELTHMGECARAVIARQLSVEHTIPPRVERYRHIARNAAPGESADWLNQLFTPSAERTAGLDYLDGVALRRVAGYVARRVQQKFVPSIGDRT